MKEKPPLVSSGRDGGRKMIPPQTSSSLCKACRWYADLAVGWHLKVVNCANLCFRLERSRIVSLSSWTTPSFPAPSPPSTPPHPPPPHQHSCRKGRGEDVGGGGVHFVGFSADHIVKSLNVFSRWFMNIYLHKLFGKWKLICSKMGDDLITGFC